MILRMSQLQLGGDEKEDQDKTTLENLGFDQNTPEDYSSLDRENVDESLNQPQDEEWRPVQAAVAHLS
eukprot:CAMPEP_0170472094 /NCGR_PEP_ID=MMETSP0123-20130129/14193_1 /TAXON_ID=182087 /ORGANISM="Favella ehrenbergii, Strain Fehren 1" /LENGTH=67 /DNA_ID=CAMNT_0010740157 /DNA_START=285 /DNA_END=488 /DNA_ORIENTATION=-